VEHEEMAAVVSLLEQPHDPEVAETHALGDLGYRQALLLPQP
jgi:hypothetical protein